MAPFRAGAACALLIAAGGEAATAAGWAPRQGDGAAAFAVAPRPVRQGSPPWTTGAAPGGAGRLHLPTALPIMRHIASTIAGYRSSEDAATENGSGGLHASQGRERRDDATDGMDNETAPPPPVTGIERAWRHARKPLLSIGAKGATLAHGNSLRQLLEAHGAVKVKVNTKQFEDSLVVAFQALAALAREAGLAAEPELLHERGSENTILVGLQGTRARIEAGEFPPLPREGPGDSDTPRQISNTKGKKRKLMP